MIKPNSSHIDRIITEMNYDIDLLYAVPCVYTRNILLNRLRERMEILVSVIQAPEQYYYQRQFQTKTTPVTAPEQIQPGDRSVIKYAQLQPGVRSPIKYGQFQPEVTPVLESALLQQGTSANQETFSLQELSRFDGKNGNPAYVAVNGIVYDVTNNAGWAAATHFGLSAGRDLTNEFASCHAGQPLLNRLPVVGTLETM